MPNTAQMPLFRSRTDVMYRDAEEPEKCLACHTGHEELHIYCKKLQSIVFNKK